MADPFNTNDPAQRRRIFAGLGYVINGTSANPATIDGLNDDELSPIEGTLRRTIDSNARPRRSALSRLNPFSGSEPEQPGAKDRLRQMIERVGRGEELSSDERTGLRAAMAVSRYNVTFDNNRQPMAIAGPERDQIARFGRQLDQGLSLSDIAQRNFVDQQAADRTRQLAQQQEAQQRAAAELARQEQARQADAAAAAERNRPSTYDQYSGMLVTTGYLPSGQVGNRNAAAFAMNQLIADTTTDKAERIRIQQSVFGQPMSQWQPSEGAIDFLRRQPTQPDALRGMLESNDPSQIRLAQSAMVGMGRTGIQATGLIDQATLDAGNAMIRQPLTIPQGVFVGNGAVNPDQIFNMSARGQLWVPPVTALSEAHQAAAQRFKPASEMGPGDIMSREQFILMRTLGENPDGYRTMLAAENERRAGLTLNATVESRQELAARPQEAAVRLDATLPTNYVGTLVSFAQENNGRVRLDQLPMVMDRARRADMTPEQLASAGPAMTEAQSREIAQRQAREAGIPQLTLRQGIEIEPGSRQFAGNLERVTTQAFRMEAPRAQQAGTIPTAIREQIQAVTGGNPTVDPAAPVTAPAAPAAPASPEAPAEGGVPIASRAAPSFNIASLVPGASAPASAVSFERPVTPTGAGAPAIGTDFAAAGRGAPSTDPRRDPAFAPAAMAPQFA